MLTPFEQILRNEKNVRDLTNIWRLVQPVNEPVKLKFCINILNTYTKTNKKLTKLIFLGCLCKIEMERES